MNIKEIIFSFLIVGIVLISGCVQETRPVWGNRFKESICGYCQYIENNICKNYECCEDIDCGKGQRCISHACEEIGHITQDLNESEQNNLFFKNLLPRGHFQTKGNQNVLVVLAEFSDVKHDPEHDIGYFEEKWSGEENSVKDYYNEASYSQLDLSVNIYQEWIELPNNKEYYEYPSETESAWTKLLNGILNEIDDSVDFSEYDLDKDGFVDLLAIIVAGDTYTLQVENAPDVLTQDNITITRFTYYSENDTPFVFVHEFAHLLGLEDQFKQVTATSYAGEYGIMGRGFGEWGQVVHHPTVWDKIQLGWIKRSDVNTIQDSGIYTINSIEKEKSIYRIPIPVYDPFSPEYFLIENRFAEEGYDSTVSDKGLIVWHIVEWIRTSIIDSNMRTSIGHRQLSMPAACYYIIENTDPYPYGHPCFGNDDYKSLHNRTELTPSSDPSSDGYYFPSGISIRNIGERGEEISFEVVLPDKNGNSPPVIESVDIQQSVRDDGQVDVKLTVNDYDPDGDSLYYFWDVAEDSSFSGFVKTTDDKMKLQFECINAREKTLYIPKEDWLNCSFDGFHKGKEYKLIVSVTDGLYTTRKKISFTAVKD